MALPPSGLKEFVYNPLDPQLNGLLAFDPNLNWMSGVPNFGLDGGFGLTGGLGLLRDDDGDENQLRLNLEKIERSGVLQGGGEVQGARPEEDRSPASMPAGTDGTSPTTVITPQLTLSTETTPAPPHTAADAPVSPPKTGAVSTRPKPKAAYRGKKAPTEKGAGLGAVAKEAGDPPKENEAETVWQEDTTKWTDELCRVFEVFARARA
jgi:hypothetical protein